MALELKGLVITVSKALRINPDINLREILRISNSNDYDVVYNPLLQGPGNTQGGTFIKPAPVHEGASTTFQNPNDLPGEASVQQLKSFQQSFNQAEGTGQSGMTVAQFGPNDFRLVPYRAGLYAEYAGNAEVLTDSGVPLDTAIDMYVQKSGDTLALPTVA